MIFGFVTSKQSNCNGLQANELIRKILRFNFPFIYKDVLIDKNLIIVHLYRKNDIYGINRKIKISDGFLFFEGYFIDNYSAEYLNMYDLYGNAKLNTLNGGFSICKYTHNRLELINDKYGLRTFWYYYTNDKFWFSNSPLLFSIINENYYLDQNSLMEFLRFGEVLENRTLIAGISHIGNASILSIDLNSLDFKISSYWDYCFNPQITDENRWAYLFVNALRSAVSSFLKRYGYFKIGISLSGGLDSRIIASAFPSKDNILTYTYGELKTLECKIAYLISKKGNYRNIYIPFKYDEIRRCVNLSVLLTLGMNQAYYLPYVAEKIYKYIDIYVHGFEGDLLFRGSYIDFFKEVLHTNSPIKLAEGIYMKYTRAFKDESLVKIFSEDIVERSRKNIINIIVKHFIESKARDPENMIDYFLLKNHAINYIILGSVLTRPYVEDVELTFDDRLIDLYLKTHPALRLKGIAYAKALKLLNRNLVKIPLIHTLTNPLSPFRKHGGLLVKAYTKMSWILLRKSKGKIDIRNIIPLAYIDPENFLRKIIWKSSIKQNKLRNDVAEVNLGKYIHCRLPKTMLMILKKYLNFDQNITFREAYISFSLLKLYENFNLM